MIIVCWGKFSPSIIISGGGGGGGGELEGHTVSSSYSGKVCMYINIENIWLKADVSGVPTLPGATK